MNFLKLPLTMVASLLFAGLSPGALPEADQPAPSFRAAKPVWPDGREKERNLTVGFRARFEAPPGKRVMLRAAGATLYRNFLNGEFLGHGPARGPHG